MGEMVVDVMGAAEGAREAGGEWRRGGGGGRRGTGGRRGRRGGAGLFARRNGGRASRELVAANARFLGTVPRALVTAYFGLGMKVEELAALHQTTPARLYRRLMAWRETLSDPTFLLAAHYAGELPGELAAVARGHWMEGSGLRALARARGATVHEVRTQVAEARVALVTAAGRARGVGE